MQCQYGAMFAGGPNSKSRFGTAWHIIRARVIVAPVPPPVRNRNRCTAFFRPGFVERYFLLHHLVILKLRLRHDFLVQAPCEGNGYVALVVDRALCATTQM